MNIHDLLLVGIEVSVAFAGFAGVIATFQFRDKSQRIKRGDVVGLTMIVDFGLICAFASTLPLLLMSFEINGPIIWGSCSFFGAIAVARSMYIVHSKMKPAKISRSAHNLFRWLQGIAALVTLSLLMNVANIGFHREPGPYIAAIVFGLMLVGFMFLRLLLRPIWRLVHEQEDRETKQGIKTETMDTT